MKPHLVFATLRLHDSSIAASLLTTLLSNCRSLDMHNAYHVISSHLQMTLLSTKVKNIVMMCTALAIIVASAVYIIGEQQKKTTAGLRHHRRDDDKVSKALRFMSPVPWPDMGKEKERKSLDRAQYAANHHEDKRNLGKRGRKKKQKRKKRKNKKKPKPKAEKSQSLNGSTASANIVKDSVVAVTVESSTEPKSSKSDKATTNTNTEEELTPYTLPFQKDTVS